MTPSKQAVKEEQKAQVLASLSNISPEVKSIVFMQN